MTATDYRVQTMLPRSIAECVPLILVTVVYLFNATRYLVFSHPIRPCSPRIRKRCTAVIPLSSSSSLSNDCFMHRHSHNHRYSYTDPAALIVITFIFPWIVPQEPQSLLGRLLGWYCRILWTLTEVVLDIGAILLMIRTDNETIESDIVTAVEDVEEIEVMLLEKSMSKFDGEQIEVENIRGELEVGIKKGQITESFYEANVNDKNFSVYDNNERSEMEDVIDYNNGDDNDDDDDNGTSAEEGELLWDEELVANVRQPITVEETSHDDKAVREDVEGRDCQMEHVSSEVETQAEEQATNECKLQVQEYNEQEQEPTTPVIVLPATHEYSLGNISDEENGRQMVSSSPMLLSPMPLSPYRGRFPSHTNVYFEHVARPDTPHPEHIPVDSESVNPTTTSAPQIENDYNEEEQEQEELIFNEDQLFTDDTIVMAMTVLATAEVETELEIAATNEKKLKKKRKPKKKKSSSGGGSGGGSGLVLGPGSGVGTEQQSLSSSPSLSTSSMSPSMKIPSYLDTLASTPLYPYHHHHQQQHQQKTTTGTTMPVTGTVTTRISNATKFFASRPTIVDHSFSWHQNGPQPPGRRARVVPEPFEPMTVSIAAGLGIDNEEEWLHEHGYQGAK
ncbi:hypothetical protein BG004_001130 [Podila humilis]|nr:hypothetical protein BG004_001130 [Podila humilis]